MIRSALGILAISLHFFITSLACQDRINIGSSSAESKNQKSLCSQEVTLEELKRIRSIGVYQYLKPNGHLSPEDVKFTITEQEQINKILDAVDYKEVDGTTMGAAPTAYIYLQTSTNRVVRAKIIGWRYLLLKDDWKKLYPLSQAATDSIKQQVQDTSKAGFSTAQNRRSN